MTDDLRERVARAIHAREYDPEHYPLDRESECNRNLVYSQADAAIALIRAETLEEAAQCATEYQHPNMALYPHGAGIAAEIRALKEKTNG